MRISLLLPLSLLLLFSSSLSSASPLLASAADVEAELSVVSHPSKLVLPTGRPVEGSPGARPGVSLSCARVLIHGFSRLRQPLKYAKALKVKVSVAQGDALFRIQTIEICFHKNFSIGVGMCPSGQWQKLSKASLVKSMSPYEHRILDVRMPPDPSRSIEVTTEEEFLVHRLVFLVLGVIMMVAAHRLSESVVFYYGGAMTLGIIVVMLIILFQGMKLLPTGRKSSLAIFLYSSIVGVGTFLLSYLSGLLRSILMEIGISEDMHNPMGILLLVCLVLGGAWFGYWGVRKLVLTEEGLVDSGVAYFVEWATLILSAVLILQSSLDTLFAAEVLGLTVVMVAMTRGKRLRFLRRIIRRMSKRISRSRDGPSTSKYSCAEYSSHFHVPESGPQADADFKLVTRGSPISGLGKTPPGGMPEGNYYSTFHPTPVRRRFTKEEWNTFTKEQTKKGLKQLVSSPDFQRWELDNVERLHVTPPVDHRHQQGRRRLLRWF